MLQKNILILSILFAFSSLVEGQQKYRTQPLSDDYQSVEVQLNKDWNSYPVMKYNSGEYIHIGFDKVAEDSYARLRYKIVYCNANWEKNTELSEVDFVDGFNDNPINDYANSFNTTIPYTHYDIKIPNEDVQVKLPGNYVVVVYDEDGEDEETILLTACFSVLDDKVTIMPEVSSTTDIDSNKEHHQLSFDLNYKLNLRDVKNDLKVFVRQNNRLDNERKDLVPNFIMPSKLRYVHNKNLIFEAGNEYHRFDMSSYRSNGKNIAHIEYRRPYYHMYVVPNKIKADGSYSYDQDQNGRYIYRNTEAKNVDSEGDYFFTHLTLHSDGELPYPIYVNGAFSNNTFTDKYKMIYDDENREYYLTLFLKQGIYNYQYLANTSNNYTTKVVDGSFYETENEYSIYVYFRPAGQRYDSLVGFVSVQSRAK